MEQAGERKGLDAWLGSHPAVILLPLAVLVLGLVALAQFPVGPPERLTGAVERIDYTVGRFVHPYGWVRLGDGKLVTVRLDDNVSCKVGDPLRLYRQRRLWGSAYAAEFGPCSARPQ